MSIDKSKLKRDYEKQPLGYIRNGSVLSRERPYKEDLIEVYIHQNNSAKDAAIYFGLNLRLFQKILKENDIKKDRKLVYQLQKQTLLRTKQVENVFQLTNVKQKSQNTCLKKYGKKHYSQTKEYKLKNYKTRKLKYNDDPYCRIKYKETCQQRYNVDNSSQIIYTDYQKELLNNKFKCKNYIKDNNIHNALEFAEKVGLKPYAALTIIHKHKLMGLFDYYTSAPERELHEYLTNNNIEFIKHYKIENKELDIYIPKYKIGIEFNGNYWHCELNKDKKYHYNKTMLMQDNGIFCYHIFEYDWIMEKHKILNKINNLLHINQIRIGAKKCKIIYEDNEISLIYNGNILQTLYYKQLFDNNYEILNIKTVDNYVVIGGISRLFNHFLKWIQPKVVITYSNIANSRDNIYLSLGFKLEKIIDPNYVWYKSGKIINKPLGNNCYRIYDCGLKEWIWKE